MASAALKPLDIQSFLVWEERQELKHEFDGVSAVASIIQGNVAAAMIARLRDAPCRFYGSDLKIQAAGSIRYPDGFVCCTRLPPNTKIVIDPVVIFEVLSESTARTDLGAKNREYEATPSVRRYIVLEQDAVAGTQRGAMPKRIAPYDYRLGRGEFCILAWSLTIGERVSAWTECH